MLICLSPRCSDQFISLLSLSHLLEQYILQLDEKTVQEDSEREGAKSYKDDTIIQLILEESDATLWTVLAPIKNRLSLPLIISEGWFSIQSVCTCIVSGCVCFWSNFKNS